MEVEDVASVLLRTEGGASVFVDVSWNLLGDQDRHYLRVLGTAGDGSVAPLRVHKEVEQGTLDVTPHLADGPGNPYTASYREELRRFTDAVRSGQAPDPPSEQVELMRLIGLAYQSGAKGKEVRA